MATGHDRLVSIDFWRGFALLTIFVNHVPGHVLSDYTYRNYGVSDAAELFVLLAGVSAAFAYLRPMMGGETALPLARVLLRAFQLYTAHLALVIVAVMVVGGFVVLTQDTRILELYHLDIIPRWPVESFVGVGLLTFQPAYLNILPLYVVLLLMAPVLLVLARLHPVLALAASAGLYLAAQFAGLALPVWPGDGGWYFNPFAWQLLFTCGLVIGAAIDRGWAAPASRTLDLLAGGYLLATLTWALAGKPMLPDLAPVPGFLWDLDKVHLAVPRLLHVLALAYCVSRLPVERWLRRLSGVLGPVMLMGRRSLPVFCAGTVLSLAAQVTRPTFDGAVSYDLLILIIGVLVQWLVAWTFEWHGRSQKSGAGVKGAPAAEPTGSAAA